MVRLGVTLAAVLLATPVLAQSTVNGPAVPVVKQGIEQFRAGDFLTAAHTLERAYSLEPVTRLLFDIARAYEKAPDVEQRLRPTSVTSMHRGPSPT